MTRETLLITPKLTDGDLNNMERSLTSRFKRVAEKFGKGIVGVLGGAGVVGVIGGIAGGIADGLLKRITGPLKETQDAIERTLQTSDELKTKADLFGTSSGNLARLHAVGTATGLDSGTLDLLITKFQTAVAEAKADPTKDTSVRRFVGDKDMAESFFQFIQGLKNLKDPGQRLIAEKEIFGEKLQGKTAGFVQNSGAIIGKIGGPSSAAITENINKGGELSDKKNLQTANRELSDLFNKNELITGSMVDAINAANVATDNRLNNQIKSFELMSNISLKLDALSNKLDEIIRQALSISTGTAKVGERAKAIEASRMLRLGTKTPGEF